MKRGGLGWVEFSVGFSAWLLGACGDDTATATIATESSTSASTGAAAGSTTGTPTTGPDVTSEPSTGISDAGSASSSTSGEPTTEPTTEPLTSTSTGDTTTDTTTDTTGAPPVCGDGEVDPDEECDQGPGNSDEGSCTLGCKNAICGDGLLGPGEACDDANQVDEDSCTNACALATCGDGKLQGDEQCDDNNTDDSDACLNTCLIAACGDGVVQAGVEECDDGNVVYMVRIGPYCSNSIFYVLLGQAILRPCAWFGFGSIWLGVWRLPCSRTRKPARPSPAPPATRVTCDSLPGFILRVLPTGKRVFFARYRDAAGKDHRHRLGLMGPDFGADEARREAMAILAHRDADASASEPVPATRRRPRPRRRSGRSRPRSASSPVASNRNISTCT
jgi:cysteine-rich repeat protein